MEARDRYDSLIEFYSSGCVFDKAQIKAQIYQESLMDPYAKSHANAMGLAQAMPDTWKEWMGERDPYNPELSISFCCIYMNWISGYLTKRPIPSTKDPREHWRRCLAAYNWGIGNVAKHNQDWEDRLPNETTTYLARIDNYVQEFLREE